MTSLVDEFQRQLRVIDQMVTAHCGLRDRYERLALARDVLVLVLSVGLVATTFGKQSILSLAGLSDAAARLVVGLVSTGVFAATVIELRVRWKERSGAHRLAAKALAELKLVGRSIDPVSSRDAAESWLKEVRRLLKDLPEIPERQFLRLKARHLRKVEVSKLIGRHPGGSLLLIRLAVFWRATFGRAERDKQPR